jgi:PAS domain S-box-containing protein
LGRLSFAARNSAPAVRASVLALAVLTSATPGAGLAAPLPGVPEGSAVTRIVVLHSERLELPGSLRFDESLRAALATGGGGPFDVFSESLDTTRFPTADGRLAQRDYWRRKYADRKPDLIVSIGDAAREFLVRHRASLFPGTPIIAGVTRGTLDSLPPGFIGLVTRTQMRTTLELALGLHPGTRRVVVLAGASPMDRQEVEIAVREFRAAAPAIEIVELGPLPMAKIIDAAASLPPHTLIFYVHILQDGDGRSFVPRDALTAIAARANAPIYGPYETFVGRGIVGGHVYSFEAAAAGIAGVALQTLRGARPDSSAIVHDANVYMFDWRQLQRWRVDERRLPAGSLVRFREHTVWDSHRWWVIGGIAALVAQAALIAGLLVSHAQRRRAQRELAERLRFETLVSDLSAAFISARDVPRHIETALERIVLELDLDRAVLAELGQSPDDVIRATHSWTRDGIELIGGEVPRRSFPWIASQLQQGHVVSMSRLADLPGPAGLDRENLAARRVRSLVAVPLIVEGAVTGALAFSTLRAEREWPDELIQRLRLVAEVLASALARHRAETAARESEDRFRLLADTAPLMIWMSGADASRTYFNRRWLEMTGRRVDEDLGERWADSVHPDDRRLAVDTYHAAVSERQPFTLDYRLRRWDGDDRWVLDHGVPRIDENGDFTGYVGSVIDITALNTALRAVLESTALRSAIFGSLYGQVAAIDRDGVIIAVNSSWTRFAEESGVDPARGATVGVNFLDACRRAAAAGDGDAARALEAITAVLAGKQEDARLEYACRVQSVERWFEMTVEPFRRPDGGAVISYIDITRRRHAEDEARRQREELAHAQRVTTLGELSASLAHEINQPLAAIVTNAQAAVRLLERAGLVHADVSEALADIAADAQRASAIIRRLRALSRKEHASQRGLDLNEIIDDVVTLLRYDLARKNITVIRSADAIAPLVSGDPVQLQQVILNLVVNASEAIGIAPDGPREIRITTALRAAGVVEVRVRDTGVGAKPSELERMFERFVSTKPGGLGMGLAISRSIVEAHGGRIVAEANPDRGLTFCVELPCDGWPATDPEASRPRPIDPLVWDQQRMAGGRHKL